MEIKLSEIAALLQQDYDGVLKDAKTISTSSATASLVSLGGDKCVLICQGTSGLLDWLGNLLFLPAAFKDFLEKWIVTPQVSCGYAEGLRWHGNWIREANEIWDWLGDRRVDLVIGHSRGAAVGAPIALTRGVTAVFFAAPRSLVCGDDYRPRQPVVNYCHIHDAVSKVVPGWDHAGEVHWYNLPDRVFKEAHRMKHWIAAIKSGLVSDDTYTI